MSELTYKNGATAFINTLGFARLVTGSNPLHAEFREDGTNKLLGAIDATVNGAGNITSFNVTNAAGKSVGTLTGTSIDAVSFSTKITAATNTEDLYFALVSAIDDNTTVKGSANADPYLETGKGNDTVWAGAGDDHVRKWSAGNLVLHGGDGFDTLEFSSENGPAFPNTPVRGAVLNLLTGAGLNPYGGNLTVDGLEKVTGTAFADTFTGNAKANIFGDGVFDGGADTIKAGLGNDTVYLSPSSQNASVDGGDGIDTLVFAFTNANMVLDMQDSGNNTGALGGATIKGFEQFAVSTGFAGGQFTFQFQGAAADEKVTGSLEGVIFPGEEHHYGKDTLSGGAGDDTLNGLTGDDRLEGEGGWDRLIAGGGRDTLDGGAGNDWLSGGAGRDSFIFKDKLSATGNVDVIADFSVPNDTIRLDNAVFTGLAAGALANGAFITAASAGDAGDHIIYNKTTGELFFDVDGKDGAAQVKFAQVHAGLALTHLDFVVI